MTKKKSMEDKTIDHFSNLFEKNTSKPNKVAENMISTKKEKQVFSFRSEKDNVKAWRLYAKISGMKVEELGQKALEEYITNHPLNDIEQKLFEDKL